MYENDDRPLTDLIPGNDVTAAMLVFQIKRILIRSSGTPTGGMSANALGLIF